MVIVIESERLIAEKITPVTEWKSPKETGNRGLQCQQSSKGRDSAGMPTSFYLLVSALSELASLSSAVLPRDQILRSLFIKDFRLEYDGESVDVLKLCVVYSLPLLGFEIRYC